MCVYVCMYIMSDYIIWIYDCRNSTTFRFLWRVVRRGYQYYRSLSSSLRYQRDAQRTNDCATWPIQQKFIPVSVDDVYVPRTDKNGSTDFVIVSTQHVFSHVRSKEREGFGQLSASRRSESYARSSQMQRPSHPVTLTAVACQSWTRARSSRSVAWLWCPYIRSPWRYRKVTDLARASWGNDCDVMYRENCETCVCHRDFLNK